MHDLVHDFARLILDDKILDASKKGSTRGGSCRYALLTDCSKPLGLFLTCPDSLRALCFLDCGNIELRGDMFSSATSLCILDLSECRINQLPNSIGHLQHLKYLNAPGIRGKYIPNHITRLLKLNYLSISGSSEILALPESIGEMEELVHLDLSGCSKIRKLPELFGNLKNMEHLDLSKCSDVTGVSEQLGSLMKLEYLDVSYCKNVGNLPRALSSLTELQYLNLSFSSYLMGIQDSLLGDEESYKYPAENISNPAGGSGIVGIVEAEILGTLTKVKYLKFCIDGFSTLLLPKLPEALGCFNELKYLDLSGSSSLYKLPSSFGKLHSLLHIDLSDCYRVEGVPEALTGLNKLRYLNLSNCSIGANEELPSLRGLQEAIANLTELRYLNLKSCLETICGDQRVDESNAFLGHISALSYLEHLTLSRNGNLYSLPETFGKLRKLHKLDLSYCCNLRKLPVSISEIGSLRFLNTDGCRSIDESTLPQFRNSSFLLPHFVVLADDGESSSNIIKLKDENPPILEISRLERVKSSAEAQRINLSGKQSIGKIKFVWTKGAERFVEDIEVLKELMPPACLEYFELQGYNGIRFPPWVTSIESYLPRIIRISITELPSCTTIPPLGQLANLQELHIEQMDSITKIDGELYGCGGAFPKLTTFRLLRMENLEEWNTEHPCGEDGSHVLVFPILTLLAISGCPKLRIKPCLPRGEYFLDIRSCDDLLSPLEERYQVPESSYPAPKGLFVHYCEQPLHEWRLLHQLPGISYLSIEHCSDLTCSSTEIIRCLSSLETFSVTDCESITALPDWLGDLTSLMRLEIINCTGIQTLPMSIERLTNLQDLKVSGCPDLVQWCESEKSMTTLAHIKTKETRKRKLIYSLESYGKAKEQ
ncbi:putative disease resistance protein RGA3 [Panicum virgatum]|nr:putative disease resistance protein RGA3 [Panicum virgatum]